MAKVSKQFKKFASSGKLKDQIKSRRQHQQIKRKTEDRNARRQKQRGAPKQDGDLNDEGGEKDDEDDDDEKDVKKVGAGLGGRAGGVATTVDELFGKGGLDEGFEDESELEELGEDGDDDKVDEEDGAEGAEEEGEGVLDEVAMKKAMKDLEKKDPEFFNYLKENDRELLSFGNEGGGKGKRKAEVDDEDDEMESTEDSKDDEENVEEEVKKTSVTVKMVRQWQEGMLKVSPPNLLAGSANHAWSDLLMLGFPSKTPFAHCARHFWLSGQLRIWAKTMRTKAVDGKQSTLSTALKVSRASCRLDRHFSPWREV